MIIGPYSVVDEDDDDDDDDDPSASANHLSQRQLGTLGKDVPNATKDAAILNAAKKQRSKPGAWDSMFD